MTDEALSGELVLVEVFEVEVEAECGKEGAREVDVDDEEEVMRPFDIEPDPTDDLLPSSFSFPLPLTIPLTCSFSFDRPLTPLKRLKLPRLLIDELLDLPLPFSASISADSLANPDADAAEDGALARDGARGRDGGVSHAVRRAVHLSKASLPTSLSCSLSADSL